ncbi:MAG: hypothetical protein R3F35_08415 [Myxococcota bacterium]
MDTERAGSQQRAGQNGLDGLLEPSLRAETVGPVPYSVRASFMVAFFGGIYAILYFTWLNSRRLGRLRRDVWLLGSLAVAWTLVLVWIVVASLDGEVPAWLGEPRDAMRALRIASRALSLGVFGLIYLRLRVCFKAAELSGREAPDPWRPGLTAVAVGTLVSLAVAAVARTLRP